MGRKTPCRINGIEYESFAAAARALGLTGSAVLSAVNRGREDYVGHVKAGFMGFPTRTAASLALGRHSNYVSRTLHGGSQAAIDAMYKQLEELNK